MRLMPASGSCSYSWTKDPTFYNSKVAVFNCGGNSYISSVAAKTVGAAGAPGRWYQACVVAKGKGELHLAFRATGGPTDKTFNLNSTKYTTYCGYKSYSKNLDPMEATATVRGTMSTGAFISVGAIQISLL